MICDIIVRGAQFQVTVVATRELLFQNEIYQQGQPYGLAEQANFLLQDCEVHSHGEAVEWVAMSRLRLETEVGNTMRPTLNDMGWHITAIHALNLEQWAVVLQDQDGEARGDQTLIQVPKT